MHVHTTKTRIEGIIPPKLFKTTGLVKAFCSYGEYKQFKFTNPGADPENYIKSCYFSLPACTMKVATGAAL